jgi:electron transfer flavoprotein alpha subunit
MSVLIYTECPQGQFKKSAFELVTFGKSIAVKLNTKCVVLVLGASKNPGELRNWGADLVLHDPSEYFDHFDDRQYATAIALAAKNQGATIVAMAHSAIGNCVLGRVAIKLGAGSVSGVNALPDVSSGFKITKSVFSGKALATYSVDSAIKVLSLMGNSIPPQENAGEGVVEIISLEVPASTTEVIERKTVKGKTPLPEAELVVSAGRGMKGPENWGIIEELADALGATTACSRPVADADWRPHHEHVGQTGVAIRPNLYIAAGISGAIQHLAGVNNSKVIVVINKDPEAPFFKAADYGVVGDLFEVVPRLTKAVKELK